MRVIAGSARGHNLRGPRSEATRPTSDMVRGAMFDMLEAMAGFEGARVLDLYAGTGALGIEALSRGAAWCDFVEDDRATCRIIAENLDHTRLAGRARVHCHPVERALGHPEILAHTPEFTGALEYDIILLDPPYALADAPEGAVWAALARLADGGFAAPEALVVLEHSKRAAPPEDIGALTLVKTRRHGDTCITIYRMGAKT